MDVLSSAISTLKGVGVKRAKLYQKLGVQSIRSLLYHFPRSYIDFSHPTTLSQANFEQPCCVKVVLTKKQPPAFLRSGQKLYVAFAMDDHHQPLKIVFFNNPYALSGLNEGETYLLYGKIGGDFVCREMLSPSIVPGSQAGLEPVYPLTAGLSSKMIITNMRQALTLLTETDPLPPNLLQKYHLCSLQQALHGIHFPRDHQQAQQARKRLIYEELLQWQLGLCLMRNQRPVSTCQKLTVSDLSPFLNALPFALTHAQQNAIDQCVADCKTSQPMNRLVQGDVGSGKTMVATALCYLFARSGMQSAMMAPTDLLARQHFFALSKALKPFDIRVELLVGSLTEKEKREVRERLLAGEIDVIVGTHALFQKTTQFSSLGLVVTDEQHRFGVNQRKMLMQKGAHPHTLVMSATPIPRTLALIIYGDLDISIIDELPAGRQPIQTMAIPPSKRKRALSFLEKLVKEGRQGYIVCPSIEPETKGVMAVSSYAQALQKALPSCRVGVLHGKLPSDQKETVMQQFADGTIQLLVSTTVIEVGIDVPNAAVIMIENAEMFGLSQLHQLRGRVGRGSFASYCILVSNSRSPDNQKRLQIMCDTCNGFEIAEFDLSLRGPGDFLGGRQHGLPSFSIANLAEDADLLVSCRQDAQQLVEQDPSLERPEHAGLRACVKRMFENSASVL